MLSPITNCFEGKKTKYKRLTKNFHLKNIFDIKDMSCQALQTNILTESFFKKCVFFRFIWEKNLGHFQIIIDYKFKCSFTSYLNNSKCGKIFLPK